MNQQNLIELELQQARIMVTEILEKINDTNDTASKASLSEIHKKTLEKIITLNDELKQIKKLYP